MPFENQNPTAREMALRLTLRGRRLIFEIGLDEDWYESAARTFKNPVSGDWRFSAPDLRRYPATLAVLLAAAGAIYYREGNLWSYLGLSGPRAALVGQAFSQSLRLLGLETFESLVEEERALRYLTPILAHGGIPRYCLADFFRLLVRTVRQGSTDPPEILSLWATRRSLTQGVDKPAIRFVLHGGEPAADFLQRCVDLVLETRRNGQVPSADDLGLPPSLVEAFAAFENEVRDTVSRDVLPRPYIQLDPWDGLGPTLELPPADSGIGAFDWRVRDERHAATYRGSHALAQTVRLRPARHWEVESQPRDGEPRTFVFNCFEPLPALFFDPTSGRLWKARDQLRLDSVWTLHDRDTKLTGIDVSGAEVTLADVEELPQPSGVWSSCRLSHYRLKDLKYLVVRRSGVVAARVAVVTPASRPTLSDGLDPICARSAGNAVLHSSMPILSLPELTDVPWDRWRVTATSQDVTRNITANHLPRTSGGFSLDPLLHDWMLREVRLSVRGPLGSDLHALFAVVLGLAVERPQHVLLPKEQSQVRLSCDAPVRLGPGAYLGSVELRVGAHVDQIRCQCSVASTDLTLVVSVPRLRWAVSRSADAGVTTSSDLVVLDVSELLESTAAALVVGTGTANIRMRLRLLAGPQTLQESDWTKTSTTGRLFFNLARFQDTVVQSVHSNLAFSLELENATVPVIRLVTRLEVEDIAVSRVTDNGDVAFECRFTDNRGMKNREARFWSIDRPWTDAVVVPVPDGAGAVAFKIPNEALIPGRYLTQVALSDPWNPPVRPRPTSPNTALITLGSPDEIEARRTRLDPADPLAAIEYAISVGRVSRPLTLKERIDVAVQIVAAACWQLNFLGTRALHSRSFHYLAECLGGTDRGLAWGASRAIEEGRVTPADLLRLAVAIIPLICTTGTEDRGSDGIDLSDSMLRTLWSTCPPIAARYDVPASVAGKPDSIERCEEFLGVRPGLAVPLGAPIEPHEWQLNTDMLRQVWQAMELKPVRLLDVDALAEANFEWLLAEREGRLSSSDWCLRHPGSLGDAAFAGAHPQEHLAARWPRQIVDTGMRLSRGVLLFSLRVAAGTAHVEQAVQALLPLVDTLPRMLSRDLTMALVLVMGQPQEASTSSPDA
jgi:hypothetical protein